jgi:hypothetical protein
MTQRSGTASTANAEAIVLEDEYRTHWNDDDVANISALILVHAPDRTIRVSAGGRSAGAACTGLSLRRPVEPGTIVLLADAFGFDANWPKPNSFRRVSVGPAARRQVSVARRQTRPGRRP